MESDKKISLGEGYLEIEGDEKGVTQFIDDFLNEKIKTKIYTKPLLKTPVKLTRKNPKKI